jgi:heme A synthase
MDVEVLLNVLSIVVLLALGATLWRTRKEPRVTKPMIAAMVVLVVLDVLAGGIYLFTAGVWATLAFSAILDRVRRGG